MIQRLVFSFGLGYSYRPIACLHVYTEITQRRSQHFWLGLGPEPWTEFKV